MKFKNDCGDKLIYIGTENVCKSNKTLEMVKRKPAATEG